ncbi:MAG TPA: ABC transporter permease [Acidaminococcaceae bacterium]|nr:ABC transporter permease [Acidaminococcaceae bacterium]
MNRLTRAGSLYFLPASLVFLLFYYWPLVMNGFVSFFSWNMISPRMRFVGFANYQAILQSSEFQKVLVNTVLFIVFLLVFDFLLPYFFSFVLSHVLHHGQMTYRVLLFLPSLLSLAVTSIIFLWIYNPVAGPLSEILGWFGLASPRWFKTPYYVLLAISTIVGWKFFGYNLIYLLAAMVSVPKEMIEAAELENASKWTILKDIIVPRTSPAAMYVFVLTIVFALQYVMVPVNMLTQGGPDQHSANLSYVIYQYAFVFFQAGRSAAFAVLTILLFVLFLLWRGKVAEKGVYYEN